MFRGLIIFLLVLYPLGAHLSIHFNLPIALWHLVLLFGMESLYFLFTGNRIVMFVFGLGAVVLAFVAGSSLATQTLLFLPALISGWVLFIFGSTLAKGRTALITRFVALTEVNITDAVRDYTRKVTIVWTVVLTLMTIEAVLLALFANQETWSLFTNLLNYIFIFIVFAIEYGYRVHRFPERQHKSFSQFMTSLTGVKWSALQESVAEKGNGND